MKISIDKDTTHKILSVANQENRMPLNIIQRAVGLYLYLHRTIWGKNNKLAIIDSGGNVVKELDYF